jgi:putative transcriptional regulator
MSIMVNNRFSAILGEKLLKISKVSKDTGISRTTLTNLYYQRSTQISFEVLNKLCTYLGCSVEDIIKYVPDKDPEEWNLKKGKNTKHQPPTKTP